MKNFDYQHALILLLSVAWVVLQAFKPEWMVKLSGLVPILVGAGLLKTSPLSTPGASATLTVVDAPMEKKP